jgi:Arabinose efflux permease
MQNIAQPWLAYRLTDSPLMLSLVSSLQFLPVLILSLFAGVIVDKISKKRILLITQLCFMIITMALALLTWTGRIKYWHLLVTSLLMGITNTFDMPSRQSFVIELVGKDDLMNAIALNSAVFNTARIFGPALAGVVMYSFGPALCFAVNSITFAAVLVSLFFIKPYPVEKKPPKNEKVLENIKDGVMHIYERKILLSTVIVMSAMCIFGMNFNVLIPVFTDQILGQKELGYGILMSCMGAGSLIGALLTASISNSGPKRFMLYIVPVISSFLLIITGFVRSYVLVGLILAVSGFFNIMFMSCANSSLQLNSANEYRGRVMSIYVLIMGGFAPFGSLYAGAVSDRFNAAWGFVACGVALLIVMIPVYYILDKKIGKLK